MENQTVNAEGQSLDSSIIREGNIIPEEGFHEADATWTPIFEKDVPTEAELRGEDQVAADQSPLKEDAASSKNEDPPPKPPDGYVPLASLHEERNARKTLAAEVERLRRELMAAHEPPAQEAEKDAPEFKILTEAEEDDLMERDIFEYQKYQRALRNYERDQEYRQQATIAEKNLIAKGYQAIEEAVPGIMSEQSNINEALTRFAHERGLDSYTLGVLTNPATKVIVPGQKQAVFLGDAAAGLVKLIHQHYTLANNSVPGRQGATREALEKELTPAIMEKVTKEVMAKLKTTQPAGYRNIGDVPGKGDIPSSGNYTENDFRNMTEDQLRAALGGT